MDNYLKSAIHKLYGDEEDFIVLGLTGKTGSGCSTVASILKNEHDQIKHALFKGNNPKTNDERKEKIIGKFFDSSWKSFCIIQASAVLSLALAEENEQDALEYIENYLTAENLPPLKDDAKIKLEGLLQEFKKTIESNKEDTNKKDFYCETLIKFHETIKEIFEITVYVKLYQKLGTNIRKSGSPIKEEINDGKFFTLAEKINSIIKNELKNEGGKTFIVIDSIRNPLEAIFFQERYAAFFLVAVSCPDTDRKDRLIKLNFTEKSIEKIDEQEYGNRKINDKATFYTQDIKTCLQKADIYLHNPNEDNESSKYVTLANQIIRFVSLMKRPGLVTPTAIERCMQIAYTAKLNSGCISRQVGAVITDRNFSIKAVGWNAILST